MSEWARPAHLTALNWLLIIRFIFRRFTLSNSQRVQIARFIDSGSRDHSARLIPQGAKQKAKDPQGIHQALFAEISGALLV